MTRADVASVSVVIPHYGDPTPTADLVAMLHAQEGADIEVIVSDDASPTAFPPTVGVRVIRRERNGGFGAAVNTGAAHATHDLLLILNSDLAISSTFVADLVSAAHPWQPCVAGPLIVGPDGHADPTARRFPTIAQQVTEWLTPLARFRDRAAWQAAVGHDTAAVVGVTASVDWLVGAALLLPTTQFRLVDGFDERFFMNAEEVDLQRRLRARGIPRVFVGTVSAIHEGGGSSDPALRRQWLVDARFRYAAKWGGKRRLRLALSAATSINLAANLARRAAGNRAVTPLSTARDEWRLIQGKKSS